MTTRVGRWTSVEGLNSRLYDLWLKSNLTKVELGRRMGVSPRIIQRWLYDNSTPSVQSLAKLCKIFNVSADYLIFGKEK